MDGPGCASHLLRGRQGGNPETVPASTAPLSPAPRRKCTSFWTQVAFQVLENLPRGPRTSQSKAKCPWLHSGLPSSRPGGRVLRPAPFLSGCAPHACVPTAGRVASHSRFPYAHLGGRDPLGCRTACHWNSPPGGPCTRSQCGSFENPDIGAYCSGLRSCVAVHTPGGRLTPRLGEGRMDNPSTGHLQGPPGSSPASGMSG